ncbi:MAG: hypothetical protein DRJ08_04230 [Acidobacteria bacterium]|nr:MAG: hypothetical protein DRJ14_06815 [Acidobacteriota bacterium]RLE22357.1 MAG: hypothetical protein DRJ08_04230 [Acidobacteriota bacterium]
MKIEERFQEVLEKVKGLGAVMLLDKEGETILMAKKPELEDYDVELFGAQAAVLLAKEIEGKNMNFLFLKGEGGSAATLLLEHHYFLSMYFTERSFAGYAEKWMQELATHVKEEFF